MIQLPETGAVLGRCGCGALVRSDSTSFRDQRSCAEWRIGQCCQRCQDLAFLGVPENPLAPPSSLYVGALVAHRHLVPAVQIAVLPFLFVSHSFEVAWEARHALCIGMDAPEAASAPLADFAPLMPELHGHVLGVTHVPSHDPRLDRWFSDLDLLAAIDRSALDEILRACPSLGRGVAVSLADAVPWRELVHRPLLPFTSFVCARDLDPILPGSFAPSSPLRLCALMGAALVLEDGGPLRHLLTSVRRLLDSTKGAPS